MSSGAKRDFDDLLKWTNMSAVEKAESEEPGEASPIILAEVYDVVYVLCQ